MIEEGADEGRVQIVESQPGWHLAETLGREAQQEAERVPIRRDGMGTGRTLLHESIREEGLEQRGEAGRELHAGASDPSRVTRSAASWRSSGTASMYQ